MKVLKYAIALCMAAICATSAHATTDLKDLLKSAASASDKNSTVNTIGNVISGLTASSQFEISALEGSWTYRSPAVSFKSENALQNIGGAAAAASVEAKLSPYYEKAGLTAMKLTVANDSSFTMQLKKGALKGKLSKDENGDLIFNFSALGKINLGKLKAYTTMSGNTLNLTFDITKLIAIAKTATSVAGIKSLEAISSLLQSYDGIYAGFKLVKDDKQASTATE